MRTLKLLVLSLPFLFFAEQGLAQKAPIENQENEMQNEAQVGRKDVAKKNYAKRLEKLMDELELSDEQKQKWSDIQSEIKPELQKLKQELKEQNKKISQEMRELRKSTESKMNEILSQDQKEEWIKIKEEHKGDRKEKGRTKQQKSN